jgi:hypothetical protein
MDEIGFILAILKEFERKELSGERRLRENRETFDIGLDQL